MFKIIKKDFDVVMLLIILSALYFKDFFFSCFNYLNLSFGSQIPLTWDFTSLNNVLPYKDIYFPYGILFYFKSNIFLAIINFFLPTILFTGIYVFLKKAFVNKLIAFFAFISFYLFISKFTGIENFSRYGIALIIGVLLSFIFYRSPRLTLKASFFIGILIGGVFSLVNDQGLYILSLFFFLLLITPILKRVKLSFNFLISRIVFSFLGFVIGFLPFLIFLISNNAENGFLLFIKHLPDFSLYAKTPFIPFSTTTDNLFTFGSIFIAVVLLSFKIFFSNKRLSLISFMELGLVFILILLEQKNIIRSIDKQITFIAFFLYIIMFNELIKDKVNATLTVLFYLIISGLIVSGFVLHPFINYKLGFKRELKSMFFQENLGNFLVIKNNLCLDDNVNKLIKNKSTGLEKVKMAIEKASKDPVEIFDYLSDPVFYVLFNQKPPYYFTIFEGTPLYAQESNVKYIKENNINYIIYNNDALSIQDGVPDKARTRLLFKYVLDNFMILDKVENFVIYKKI
ncbi:MAG: hypothetical protein HYW62_02740 [Candidatus Levybacteria bacterium]|nr:hypothetical protein [Candidatus Levybacteria bacterium]